MPLPFGLLWIISFQFNFLRGVDKSIKIPTDEMNGSQFLLLEFCPTKCHTCTGISLNWKKKKSEKKKKSD